MSRAARVAVLLASLAFPGVARADAPLFTLYLLNGESLVSFGEVTRLDDRVIFSMPVGGSADEPRLQVVSLQVELVDWERTEHHAASTRYQRYAATRGDDDFRQLTVHVARVLSDIALTTDRRDAWPWPNTLAAPWPTGRVRTTATARTRSAT